MNGPAVMKGMGDTATALRRFAQLVDDRVGLIGRVDIVRPAPGTPEVFVAHAEPSDTRPLIGMAAANRGAAASVDVDRAIVRACGESVERYCAAFCPADRIREATADLLRAEGGRVIKQPALYPFARSQYEEAGFPFTPVDGRSQRWVAADAVPVDAPGFETPSSAWVPASCVYVPYLFDQEIEPFTHMPISTGLAAGPSVAACIDKGIWEIVERDALMVRWHNRLPATVVRLASLRGADPMLDRSLDSAGVGWARWHISLITTDVEIPVMLAALIDDGRPDARTARPMTSVGVAAAADPVRAVLLAVEEALLTRALLARSSELQGEEPPPADSLRGHMLAHAFSPALREELRFLTDPPTQVDLDTVLGRFRRSASASPADHLAECGLHAWSVEVTTPDVAQVGLRVVRTLVPGMQPLDNDHRYRYLGGDRLVTVPGRLGVAAPTVRNPHPHPFP